MSRPILTMLLELSDEAEHEQQRARFKWRAFIGSLRRQRPDVHPPRGPATLLRMRPKRDRSPGP